LLIGSCYGVRKYSAYRISQLEIAGKIMNKKITWPSLFFGPINLWNCPRQEELREILRLKHFKQVAYTDAVRAQSTADLHKLRAQRYEQQIKEREFLYYLRSGRFPDEPNT
jgi:hypothetical protein